ncbi:ATP-binding protein [bacterium]|nr:ATP-binding protein [bacterium]
MEQSRCRMPSPAGIMSFSSCRRSHGLIAAMSPEVQQFSADLDQLPLAIGFASRACATAGLPPDACLKAELVIEELFSNTVRHGYGIGAARRERPVWIGITREDDGVIISYQDAAPQHNPLVEDPDLAERTVSRRHIGGLGRVLVRDLPRDVSYSVEDGRNTVRFRLGGAART